LEGRGGIDIGIELSDLALRAAVGAIIGLTIGMTGIGGGVLVVPSLIHVIKIPPVSSVGTAFLYALVTRIYGAYEHFRLNTVRRRTAFYFIIGSAPGVLSGSVFVNYLSKHGDRTAFDLALQTLIGIVLLITFIVLSFRLVTSFRREGRSYYRPPKVFPRGRKIAGAAAGFAIGTLVGMTSVGGGVLIIPVLMAFFNLSPEDTVGTSIAISVVLAAIGFLTYLFYGNVMAEVAAGMFLGSIPGVWLGSRLSVKIPRRVLELIVIGLVVISAAVMFIGMG